MKLIVAITLTLVASAFAQVELDGPGQTGLVQTFPYCICDATGSYRLENVVTSRGNNTYCFTIRVSVPANCSTFCCTGADLKKLEFNIKPTCNIAGVIVTATLNGAPTSTRPNIELAPQGPVSSTILKVTNLGLNRVNADGAQLCLSLGTNRGGQGCTTLEQLCVPPTGAAPGTCSASLFNSNNNCCPQSNVNTASAPPPPPSPPIVPGNVLCETCVDFSISAFNGIVPYSFTSLQCSAYAAFVANKFVSVTAGFNETVYRPFELTNCTGQLVKICGKFRNPVGAAVAPLADDIIKEFLDLLVPNGRFPPYLTGHTIAISIVSSSTNAISNRRLLQDITCPMADISIAPFPENVTYPKCICDTKQGVMPIAALPFYTVKPNPAARATQYCFTLVQVAPVNSSSKCGRVDTITKLEFWANETVPTRRAVKGFYIKPSTASSYTFISPTWSARGEETLRATGLNWSIAQANGAEVCMELDNGTSLDAFCLGPYPNGCYLNIFDESKDCCPMYTVIDGPYVP